MKGAFNLIYFLKGAGAEDWFKALGLGWRLGIAILLVFFIASGIKGCFSKEPQNINKPKVIVTPFSKVDKIDQTSTQISIEEKKWEFGFGLGALTYDNKNGGFAGGWVKRKF